MKPTKCFRNVYHTSKVVERKRRSKVLNVIRETFATASVGSA